MFRRIIHVSLLLVGLVPVVWAVCIIPTDPRRAGALIGLSALGISLNAAVLLKPGFGLRVPMRVIAAGVALVVLAGVMAMWNWVRNELLPSTPPELIARRELLQAQAVNLLWITVTVAYVFLSILILPLLPPKPPPSDKPEKIDFRTYGR